MTDDVSGFQPRVGRGARERCVCLSLALLVGALAAMPLLIGPGIVNTRAGGDSPFLVQRVHQLSANLRAGVFPARWMWDAAHGMGYPFYSFYAALPYYIASLLDLAGWGVLWGIKLAQLLGFLLAAGFSYHLALRLGAAPKSALLASVCYSLAPFHLVNVYVRGDALSEFYAQAWYPLILAAALAVSHRPSARSVAWLAGSYTLLVLTHNISALIFSPLVVGWLMVCALSGGPERLTGRTMALGAVALALGLALGAWFWVPALREQPLVQLGEQTTGYFHYPGHFRSKDLVQGRLVHDYSIDGERNPFCMGLAQAAVALMGLGGVARRAWRRRASVSDAFLAAALLVYTWLITPWSRCVWDHLPLLPYAQFPWRMLSVQALLVAALARHIPELAPPGAWRSVAVGVIAAMVGVGGLAGLRVDRLPLGEGDVTPQRFMLYETYSGNIGSTVRHEYLPAEMVPRPHVSGVQLSAGVKPAPLVLDGRLSSATALEVGPRGETWEMTVAEPTVLAFHTTFYPGWQALVDGEPVEVRAAEGLGMVSLRVQEGTHSVELAFKGTRTQRYASWASAVALLIWLGLVVLSLVALGWVVGRTVVAPSLQSQPLEGPLVMDFVRAPYLHPEPDGVHLGDAVLVGYRISTDTPSPGERLLIGLEWKGAAGDACRLRLELTGASAHLYPPAPLWAEAEEPLLVPHQDVVLDLPSDIPPGIYVPHLSVTCDGRPVEARNAGGRAMGTPGLAPVQVVGARPDEARLKPLAYYGPEHAPPVVALLGARARVRQDGDTVEVTLAWRSERQAPLNYMLSVRLISSSGEYLIARDLPPLYGGYPTSLWRPGELLTDRVLLPRPEGVDLAGAGLEIVLYDRQTLRAVGTAHIADAVGG